MRLAIALLTAVAVVLAWAASAGACSCVGGDPRDRLSEARAAFVGTVAEERIGARRRTYRLAVEKAYKGDVPETVEVTADPTSSCAVDFAVG